MLNKKTPLSLTFDFTVLVSTNSGCEGNSFFFFIKSQPTYGRVLSTLIRPGRVVGVPLPVPTFN